MRRFRLQWKCHDRYNWRGHRGPWRAQVLRIGDSWHWDVERVVSLWHGRQPQNGLPTADALKGSASSRRGAQRATQKAVVRMRRAQKGDRGGDVGQKLVPDGAKPAPVATVGAVSIRFTPSEVLVRCAGCERPSMARAPESETCAHCGRPLRDGAPCSRSEFLASRADDAALPPRPGRPRGQAEAPTDTAHICVVCYHPLPPDCVGDLPAPERMPVRARLLCGRQECLDAYEADETASRADPPVTRAGSHP